MFVCVCVQMLEVRNVGSVSRSASTVGRKTSLDHLSWSWLLCCSLTQPRMSHQVCMYRANFTCAEKDSTIFPMVSSVFGDLIGQCGPLSCGMPTESFVAVSIQHW